MVDVRAEQQLVSKDLVAKRVGDYRREVPQHNLSFHPWIALGKGVGFVVASGVIVWIRIAIWWDDHWKRRE